MGLSSTMGIGVVLSFMAQGIGNINQASRAMSLFATNADGMVTALSPLGRFAALALGSILALKAGISGLNAVMENVNLAEEFEHEMARIQGITETPAELMGGYEQAIMDIARTSRFSSIEVAEGFRRAAQAGYAGQQMIDLMTASVILADTKELDMAQATDTLVSALHAFQIPAAQSMETINMLGKAVSVSQLEFDDLRGGLGTFGMTAQAAGQSLEEMLALYGGFVTSGLSPSRAAMMVKMMLTTLMGSTPTSRTFMDSIGVEYIDPATGRLRSLLDIMEDVRVGIESGRLHGSLFEEVFGEITNSTEEAEAMYKGLVAMFGRRAIAGYFGASDYMYETADATYLGIDAFREMADQILNNGEFMEDYHDIIMDTNLALRDLISTGVQDIKMQLGTALMESLKPVLEFIVQAIQTVQAFLASHPQVAAAIGAGAALMSMIVTLGGVFMTIMAGITFFKDVKFGQQIIATIVKYGPALLGVLSTALWVLVAIVAIVAAIVVFWDELKAALEPVFSFLYDQFAPVLADLWAQLKAAWPILKGLLIVILAIVAIVIWLAVVAIPTVIYIILTAIDFIVRVFETLYAVVVAVFNFITGRFSWANFKAMLDGIWDGFLSELIEWFAVLGDSVITFFTGIWEKIKELLGFSINPEDRGVYTGATTGEEVSAIAANQPGGSSENLWNFNRGAYNISKDGPAYLHAGEQVVQSGAHPYQSSQNAFTIGNVTLQVVAANPDYDADRLFSEFMRRLRSEGERVMT